MREQEFYRNIEIDDDDKPRAERSLRAKGVEKHILIKNHILTWREGNAIRYSEIASTYRYDKRIRNTLFKYISFLEEFYRAVTLDNYYAKPKKKFWIDDLKNNLIIFNNDLDQALERLDFPV